jgi:hypothetical protein
MVQVSQAASLTTSPFIYRLNERYNDTRPLNMIENVRHALQHIVILFWAAAVHPPASTPT